MLTYLVVDHSLRQIAGWDWQPWFLPTPAIMQPEFYFYIYHSRKGLMDYGLWVELKKKLGEKPQTC